MPSFFLAVIQIFSEFKKRHYSKFLKAYYACLVSDLSTGTLFTSQIQPLLNLIYYIYTTFIKDYSDGATRTVPYSMGKATMLFATHG